jgi:hypothetical protein
MPANSNDRKNRAKHILPTAADLLGLSFVIFTLKKLWMADGVERLTNKLDGMVIIIFFGRHRAFLCVNAIGERFRLP